MKFNGIGMLTNRRHGRKEALYEVTVIVSIGGRLVHQGIIAQG